MSEPVHLICGSCGAENRVPAHRLVDRPICGQCREALFSNQPFNLGGPALERHVATVMLSVRNEKEGWLLLEEFAFGGTVGPIHDAQNIATAEVIINATPMGMIGKSPMPEGALERLRDALPDAVVMDMVYNPVETAFLSAAREAGCRTVDGFQMLIGQAAVAFEKFFGQPAPREHDAELRALLTA